MQTLGITTTNKSRCVAQFQPIGIIENIQLGFGLYKSTDVKVTLLNDKLKDLQNKLCAYNILESAWIDIKIEQKLNISSRKQYNDNFLSLIKDTSNRKYLEKLTQLSQFLFTYNSMTNINQNLRYTFDKFFSGQIIAMQFYVHFLNFQTAKNLDAKFKNFF